MAKRHQEILARLDAIGLRRYNITEKDVREVEKYLGVFQKKLKPLSTWQEMVQYGGPYGTSILIHEVVEIKELRDRGFEPLRLRKPASLSRLLTQNIDAHIIATYQEHCYLQEVIGRLYGERFEVATLVKANRNDERDLQLFLESEVGVYIMEEERVEEARQTLARLKGDEE